MTLELKQSTAIDIRVGPFVDATDAVTPETGITLGAADQAEVLKADGAATVAMAGAFVAVTGCDGWYDYTAATGDVDTLGEIEFVVQDASVSLPVFVRGTVIPAAVWDAKYVDQLTGPYPKLGISESGTAQAATGTTLQLRAASAFADDEVIGSTVVILTATAGAGQSRIITDYVSSTDTATVDTWTTTPTGTITYMVIPTPPSSATSPVEANMTQISGDATAADNLELDYDGTGYAKANSTIGTATTVTGGATAAALATVDTVVDAIKVKTDPMTYTKANELDANVQSINGAAVTGDGNATPWDGA